MDSFFDEILPTDREEEQNGADSPDTKESPEPEETDQAKEKPKKKKGSSHKKSKGGIPIRQEKRSKDKNSSDESAPEDRVFEQAGELTIDFYQTDDAFVIQAPVGGISADDIDVSVENDVVSITGMRRNPSSDQDRSYYNRECHWGAFARQVLLPDEIDPGRIEATLKEGVFTLRLPKVTREKTQRITVEEEE